MEPIAIGVLPKSKCLALRNKVCYTTTLAAGEAYAIAIRYERGKQVEQVRRLQDLHKLYA